MPHDRVVCRTTVAKERQSERKDRDDWKPLQPSLTYSPSVHPVHLG
jgi:hypothetical protein